MFIRKTFRVAGWTIALLAPALALAAEQKLDPDKLKPGDKLEYRKSADEWQMVEFVGKGTTENMLLVNRPPFSRPVPTRIALLRLPQAGPPPVAKAEAPKPVDDLTAKPRTWSDRTGGFKVEAVLVRVEDGKVVLKRTDTNAEISVPLEKLSDADRKLLDSTQSADTETLSMKAPRTADAAAAPKTTEATEAKSPSSDSIALTPTDYKTAKKIELPDSTPWKFEPEVAPKATLGRAYSIRLKPGTSVFDSPERVLPLPKDRKAFVVFLDHTPGNDKYIARVQACSLDSGTVDGAAVFGVGFEPLEISEDGSLVLGRSSGFFNETHKELRIYQRTGHTVKPLCAWQPCATSKTDSEEQKSAAHRDLGVRWAAFIDNQHVMTVNDDVELVLWEIPSLKPVYRVQMDWLTTPILSANKKYLFTTHHSDRVVISTADGQLAGRLKETVDDESSGSLANAALALSLDGKRLAVARANQIRVWDLQSQKLVRDFIIDGMMAGTISRLDWISDNHLMVGGQMVIDVERRIPISKSLRPLEAYDVEAGKTWYVEAAHGRDPATLKVATMPDEAMLAAAAKINPDDLLVLRPGMSVGIDVQASGTPEEIERAKRALVERLVANGMSVAPDSTTRIVMALGTGKTETMRYSRMFGKPEEVQVPTMAMSLSFQANGETLWRYERQSHPPSGMIVNKDETLEQVVAREMETRNKAISIQALASVRLPTYVARIPKVEKPK